jgi:hypothetical protein
MTTYYVDATGGNDGDLGTSEGTAWQTIGKVNGETFASGDSILFKRGETWVTAGSSLVPPSSGTAGSPITLADYGSGAKPIIDGNDLTNCIYVLTKHDLIIRNFELTQGIDSGLLFSTSCYNIQVIDCDAHDCGNDNVLFIGSCYDCSVTGGRFYNAYQRVLGSNVTGMEITNGCHDITFSGVTSYDNTGTGGIYSTGCGVSIHSHFGTGMPYNIVVENSHFYGNSGYGIQILKQDATVDTDRSIIVRDCISDSNYEGIHVYTTTPAFPNGVDIRRCAFLDNTNRSSYLRGDYIVFACNVADGKNEWIECTYPDIFRNTFCMVGGMFHNPVYLSAVRTDHIEMKNNIIYHDNGAGGESMIWVDTSITSANIDIDYNLYYLANESVGNIRWVWKSVAKNWADWKTDSGQDANSPAADQDPLFIDVSSDNFHLQHGSPALQVGTPLTGYPFYGAAPDCGRWEMRWKSVETEQRLAPKRKFA